MIDADNFKAINDQYGHNAGDQAIKAVSKAIQSCIRSDDIFIRYGGDEFLLVFQDIHYNTFHFHRSYNKNHTQLYKQIPFLQPAES